MIFMNLIHTLDRLNFNLLINYQYDLIIIYLTMNFDCKVVVIDNGTGYTKMGHAGNSEPSFDIPTLIA